jgi:hypothetical protein
MNPLRSEIPKSVKIKLQNLANKHRKQLCRTLFPRFHFQRTVTPYFRKSALKSLGFWSTPTTNSTSYTISSSHLVLRHPNHYRRRHLVVVQTLHLTRRGWPVHTANHQLQLSLNHLLMLRKSVLHMRATLLDVLCSDIATLTHTSENSIWAVKEVDRCVKFLHRVSNQSVL